jgi:hypothetical protein
MTSKRARRDMVKGPLQGAVAMTARRRGSASDRWRAFPARLLLMLSLVGLLGWRIIAHGVADVLIPDDPKAALSWEPDNPAALMALTRNQLLSEADPANARTIADEAAALLARDPLADGALSVYGLALDRLGDTARAEKVLTVAAAHAPTDLLSHARLYEKALKTGDALLALSQLDFLLRGRPGIADRVGPSVASLLIARDGEPDARFVRLLVNSPPWRTNLMGYFSNNLPVKALTRLFTRLKETSAPPTRDEMSTYIERLVREGDYEAAHFAFVNFLPKDRLASLGLLYNNRFQYPTTDLPFDWQIFPAPGVSAQVAADEKEPAIKVDFYGARVAVARVRHLLALPPGDFVFSGVARSEDLETERGLRWRVYCLADAQGALATTEFLTKTTPRHPFRAEFTVPAEGCGVQGLVLELPARIASEAEISGTAVFSSLLIDKR